MLKIVFMLNMFFCGTIAKLIRQKNYNKYTFKKNVELSFSFM